jgi:hypothetical protein
MPDKKESYLKIIKEYLPLIYIFLVCFGYFDKSLYFNQFEINILNYLSIPELILIFIPLGSMIFTSFILLIIVFSPALIFRKTENKLDSEDENITYNLLFKIRNIPNKILRKILENIYFIVGIFIMIYLQIIPLLLFFYYAISRIFTKVFFNKNIFILSIILWGIFFFLKFKFQRSKIRLNPKINLFVYSIMISIGFVVYFYMNINTAERILNGKSDYYVKFRLDSKIIETNKDLLYFGQTNQYIFLRAIETNESYIYNKKNIKEFIIRKNKNTVANTAQN